MKYKDYYKILSVSRDATQDQIKTAYRKLARKYHPDVSKVADAEEKFKEVGEAYEVLKDPEKRSAYDQFGNQWKEGQGFKPPPDWDSGFEFSGGGFTGGETSGFSDFFETLFGGAKNTRGWSKEPHGFHARGADHHAKISISLEEAFKGSTQLVSLKISDFDSKGQLETKTHTLNVKIPKGIKEGQRIRLYGQGGVGPGGQGQKGDLYLEIRFKPHRVFHAQGRDIYLELPLAPWEAALGATVKAPTLGGRVELKIPPSTKGGEKLRLNGRGLPGKPPGDQIVNLKIIAPPATTPEATDLYNKMAKVMAANPRAGMGV